MKNKLYLILAFIFSISLANAQYCREDIPDNTPNIRYTVHDDGTVTDDSTKLMWKVCSEGQTWDTASNTASCIGLETEHNWQPALQIPKDLNAGNGYAGYTDWRLPNINELVSIMSFNCFEPSVNAIIFPNTNSGRTWFWSSSPAAEGGAWYFIFSYGNAARTGTLYSRRVRLVRGGQ